MAGDIFISGLTGTNFDGGAIVDQIMQLRAIPIQRLRQEGTFLEAKASSINNLVSSIGDFFSLFDGLTVDDLFKGKKATVVDTDILDVTVSEEAPSLEFNVTVNRLAQAEARVSNGGMTGLTSTFSASGTLSISYNTGSATETFSIDYSAGDTLEDLVNSINAGQSRVKASIYYDGSTYRLMLSESGVGASTVETDTAAGVYVINVSGLPSELGTGLDTLQGAQNAEIVIGSGSPITSPSNTFENVISGVTIEAKTTGTTKVTIDESFSKVTAFLENFVNSFNSLSSVVDALTSGDQALFRGDYTISSVKTGITERLDPLIELGLIEYSGDTGQISLKTDRLSELLTTDPDSVRSLIEELKTSYGAYLEGQKNLFSDIEETYNDQIESIDQRIQTLAERLVQEERILRREYARLEAFIAEAEELRNRFRQFMVSLSRISGGGEET